MGYLKKKNTCPFYRDPCWRDFCIAYQWQDEVRISLDTSASDWLDSETKYRRRFCEAMNIPLGDWEETRSSKPKANENGE